jgi:hypothetical protein
MPVAFTLLWAQAASLGKFKGRLAFLQGWTRSARRSSGWRASHRGRSRPSRRGAVTDVADLRKVLDEDTRLTLIVSLLHRARTGVRDDVVTMFCKRLASIHKKGRIQLETLREVHRAESERLLGMFGDVLDGVREAMSTAVPLARLTQSGTTRSLRTTAVLVLRPGRSLRTAGPASTAGRRWSSAPAGWRSRRWTRPEAWRCLPRRMTRCRPITATTTCRYERSDLLPASATGTT